MANLEQRKKSTSKAGAKNAHVKLSAVKGGRGWVVYSASSAKVLSSGNTKAEMVDVARELKDSTSTKESAREFLRTMGMITPTGRLTKTYGG